MKRIITLLLLFTTAKLMGQAYTNASCYIVAHPDDWQLFMGTDAFHDIATGADTSKVIIIYTTAGDESYGYYPVYEGYCNARILGANRSVQFCADLNTPHAAWDTSYTMITTKEGKINKILRLQYKNVVSYFFKLPDGCFEHKNINTLSKFAYSYHSSGFYADYCSCAPTSDPRQVSELASVDGSAIYKSYYQLEQTIAGLLSFESAGIPKSTIHAQEIDPFINPGDHPDHVQTGALAIDVANMVNSCSDVLLYQDYSTCDNLPNLSNEQISVKAALLSQVSYGLNLSGFPGEWDPKSTCGHVAWTNKVYSRLLQSCDSLKKDNNTGHSSLFPNPTTSILHISYNVLKTGTVEIALYDLSGRLADLIVNENKEPGNYLLEYDTRSLTTADYMLYIKTATYVNALKFTKNPTN